MIEINNLTTNLVDEEFLKGVAKKVLEEQNKNLALGKNLDSRYAQIRKESDLSIAMVGQGRIRELNKKYRGKNRVTDVLAFPGSRVLLEKFKVGPIQKVQNLGEIIICFREVKKNSKKFQSTFEKELARVLIHGILHLLGYDHEKSNEEAKEMEKKQEYYLSKISDNGGGVGGTLRCPRLGKD